MKYFHLNEFECHCKCGRAEMNQIFLGALDQLRERFGKPLVVTSGYRCPSHNVKVSKSGPNGPHTTGKAVDLAVSRGDAYQLLRLAQDMGFTGIGVQQKGGARFLHLDMLPDAPGQPRPTVWSY